MSAYSGPQHRGARALRKKEKRAEAEARNAVTVPERRAAFRRQQSAA